MHDSGTRTTDGIGAGNPIATPVGWLAATLIGVGGAAVGGILIELGRLQGLRSREVLRDVAASFHLPAMVGAVTFMSVALLIVAGTATALATFVLRERRALAAAVAAVSLLLAIDDQFMLHERVLPSLTGLPEELFLALDATGGLIVFALALKELGLRGIAGLWPAIVFIALSVVADLDLVSESSYATEDLLKLAGFTSWTLFWFAYAVARLTGREMHERAPAKT